jgi:hypothetical protein
MPQVRKRCKEGSGGLNATQAGLPGTGDTVKGRGDAVPDQLAVRFQQGSAQVKNDPGAGHDLPFERIPMNVDDSGQDQEA